MNDPFDSDREDIDASVQCSDCEAVCCRLTVLLMPGDVVPAWLTEHDDYGLEHMAQREDGWCVAVDRDSMRCTIYASRPQLCRSFAMGSAACIDEREAWFGKSARAIPLTVLASTS